MKSPDAKALIQLGDNAGEQVRIALTPVAARDFALRLQQIAAYIEAGGVD